MIHDLSSGAKKIRYAKTKKFDDGEMVKIITAYFKEKGEFPQVIDLGIDQFMQAILFPPDVVASIQTPNGIAYVWRGITSIRAIND